MISRPLILLRRLSRLLVVRVSGFALIVLLAGFFTPLFETGLSEEIQKRFGPDAVLPLLNLLAPTMLTVTTFALGVMVQSSRAAQSLATPRAFRILMEDPTTQNVLTVFTGSFLFSLMGIVMFRSGFYGQAEGVTVFAMTVVVIVAIVVSIVRWIAHLDHLGSLDHTLDVVTQSARAPLRRACKHPAMGARFAGHVPDGHPVRAAKTGYVQYVDLETAQSLMESHDAELHLVVAPGAYITRGQPLAILSGAEPGQELEDRLAACFTQGGERTLEQDARFALVIMSEIAARALSPGVNDPGTAIDVVHRNTGLLSECLPEPDPEPRFDRIFARPICAADLVEDAFHPVIRYGAGQPEVVTHLCAAFDVLELSDWSDMADAARTSRGYLAAYVAHADLPGTERDALERHLKRPRART